MYLKLQKIVFINESAEYLYPKSTVPVGTGSDVKKFVPPDKIIHYVSNPEFLREGTALKDSLFFDRIVVGGDDEAILDEMLDLYKSIEKIEMSLQVAPISIQ